MKLFNCLNLRILILLYYQTEALKDIYFMNFPLCYRQVESWTLISPSLVTAFESSPTWLSTVILPHDCNFRATLKTALNCDFADIFLSCNSLARSHTIYSHYFDKKTVPYTNLVTETHQFKDQSLREPCNRYEVVRRHEPTSEEKLRGIRNIHAGVIRVSEPGRFSRAETPQPYSVVTMNAPKARATMLRTALCLPGSSRAIVQANRRCSGQRRLIATPSVRAEIQKPRQSALLYKSLQHPAEVEVTRSETQRQEPSRLAVEVKQEAHEEQELHYTVDPSFLSTISAACSLPHKLGVDICYIPRVAKLLADEQKHFKFWRRVLNPLETALYKIPPHKKTGFLAGRWAAKEAIIKAWGAQEDKKEIFMHDIIILTPKLCRTLMVANGNTGSFRVSKEGQAQEAKQDQEQELEGGKAVKDADKVVSQGDVTESGPPRAFVCKPDGTGWKEVSISISHDADYAMAVALVTADAAKTEHV